MALKIVTGGTTGAADGTLVSSGNPLVIVALNTAVDAHIRCDDGYWSNDQTFDVPAELEVSFDGGTTWYDNADEPITASELYAVNVPIKIRQTTAASSTSGSFITDGTYTAIAALSTPTLTATVISATQIDLSWTNVANEDASPGYTIERSPDGSSWSALTTKAANVTTHSDTGLSPATHYYYRVKAEGSGRYTDSGWGTDDDTTSAPPPPYRDDLMTDTDGTTLTAHTPVGVTGGGAWTKMYDGGSGGTPEFRVKSNRVLITLASGTGAISLESWLSGSSNADCAAELDAYVYSAGGGYAYVTCRNAGASFGARNQYRLGIDTAGAITLGKIVAGSFTSLDTDAYGALSTSTMYTLRVEAIGTAIKGYVNGVERVSATDSSISAGGGVAIGGTRNAAAVYTDPGTDFGFDAVRLINI